MPNYTVELTEAQQAAIDAEAGKKGVTASAVVYGIAHREADGARVKMYNNWWSSLGPDDKQALYDAGQS